MGCNLSDIVKKMLILDLNVNSFPSFLAGYNFGRGLFSVQKESPHIVAPRKVVAWKVIQDKLQKKDNETVLFDGENYVIEWHFDYVLHVGGEVKTEIFFFHWKGMNALKGFSPLPLGRNLDNVIVERIYQWGEPPVFFHIFPQKLIVFSDKEDDFKPSEPHLLMLRGETVNELHLFEIPCCRKNFRSKAIFFLIVPSKKTIYIWFGFCVDPNFISSIRNCKNLYTNIKNAHPFWEDFQFVEVNEAEDKILKDVLGNTDDYFSIKENNVQFAPRLFYLVFDDDDINPIEIKNPLRAPNVNTYFPFVQTHLYTAAQPAIFLLDNFTVIWLWRGEIKPETDVAKFNKQLNMAEQLLDEYIKNKRQIQEIDVTVRHTNAGQEPIDFTNIFPYWKS